MKSEWGAVLIILFGCAFLCAAMPVVLPLFIIFALFKIFTGK